MIKYYKFINLIYFIFFFFIVLLISHRTAFDIKLLKNFYKIGYGYNESIIIYKKFHYHAKEIKDLVKKYDISEYNIDENLLGDPFIFESSYPSKFSKNAKYYFSKKKSLDNCKIFKNADEINLFICK